ncbi:MAG: rod shape-determining protein MreD [Clostridia bacterium]|nr:rod shape-determining protein MreD [Clostridia bacterium]
MKKVLINLAIIVVFLIIYFLQANFFTWFKIAGIMPNLFIILILFIGMFMGKIYGLIYGVVFGILIDIFIGKSIGITSIMLAIVGIIAIIFDKNFSKDSRIAIMIIVAISTIIYESGGYILSNILLGTIDIEIIEFIKILLIEVIFNVILTIIIYPIMQLVGYDIEEEFKGSKILTKYF